MAKKTSTKTTKPAKNETPVVAPEIVAPVVETSAAPEIVVETPTLVESPASTTPAAERRSLARTIATRIVDLDVEETPALRDYAKKLETEKSLTNEEWSGLRDAINVAAFFARKSERQTIASQLSALNKLIRRSERATRAK